MKKLKFIVFMIFPGTVCYLYNLFLEFRILDNIPREMYIENLYKYIVIYNILFNGIMIFLAKFAEIQSAENYLNYVEEFFLKTFYNGEGQ